MLEPRNNRPRCITAFARGQIGDRSLHVVAATTPAERIVITVYEPDPIRWDADLKRRKP